MNTTFAETRCTQVPGYIIIATGSYACSADGLFPTVTTVAAGAVLATTLAFTFRRSRRARATFILLAAAVAVASGGALAAASVVIAAVLGVQSSMRQGPPQAHVVPTSTPKERRRPRAPSVIPPDLVRYPDWNPVVTPLACLITIDALYATTDTGHAKELVVNVRNLPLGAVETISEQANAFVQTIRGKLKACSTTMRATMREMRFKKPPPVPGAGAGAGDFDFLEEETMPKDRVIAAIATRTDAELATHGAKFVKDAFVEMVLAKCSRAEEHHVERLVAVVDVYVESAMQYYNDLVLEMGLFLISSRTEGVGRETLDAFKATTSCSRRPPAN